MCTYFRKMTGTMKRIGSKAEVYHGTARMTPGGVTRAGLMTHKGRIVSKKKHAAGLKSIKRLRALGYVAKKGQFTLFRKSMAHGKSKTRKHKTRKHKK